MFQNDGHCNEIKTQQIYTNFFLPQKSHPITTNVHFQPLHIHTLHILKHFHTLFVITDITTTKTPRHS